MTGSTKSSLWGFTLSGLIGVAIGAGGMVYAQKQATTAENQYYMQLDQLRHATFLDEDLSIEAKLEHFDLLRRVRRHGYREVFEQNLDSDMAELQASLDRIQQASDKSAARAVEDARVAAEAQARKEQAVRTNPLIYQSCGAGTDRLCP